MKLNRFFTNPFLTKEISLTELQGFTEDHLAKVAAANSSGQFDAMLTDTGAAYANFFGEMSNVSLRSALRKAATEQMELRWKALVKWVTTKGEARVIDKAGKPSAVYTEFFPSGLTEYHSATTLTAQTLAMRLRTSATTHSDLLGADFAMGAESFTKDYLDARNLQTDRKGETTDARGSRDEDKAVLQTQLFKNLLELAVREMNPEKCSLYFSQHLLEDPDISSEDAVPPTPLP